MAVTDICKEQPYRLVHNEDIESESPDASGFIKSNTYQKSHFRLVGPWIFSTVSLAFISIYLLFQQQTNSWSECLASGSPAFQTDLHDAHPYISYEERVFSGRLWYREDTGMIYRDIDPSEPQYFGPPNPGIDAAWADLLRGTIPSRLRSKLFGRTYPAFTNRLSIPLQANS
jgi:hypothetical protein